MWARKVAPDLSQDPEAQLPGDKIRANIISVSAQNLDVDKSLASIRSHRSNKDEDLQDDVPFGVPDWSPAWSDVATDGYALFNLFLHINLSSVATTSLFFLAIAYTDALCILAMVLLYYALGLMLLMFIHLANVKGRQFVYVQLLQRKVLLDLTAVTWYKIRLTQAIFVACFLAFALFVGTWFDTNGPTRGSTAAAFAVCSSLAMIVLKEKTYLQQERYLVPLNFIMQDDPEGANHAPSRKAWVSSLTVIKEVDFQRYVASRYIKSLIDPVACPPMPHGRDKWDRMAADMIDNPELDAWPARGVKDVQQSEVWATWTTKQQNKFTNTFESRFGWAFYFGTVQYDKIEIWKPWVLTTLATTLVFLFGCVVYGVISGTKKGDAAMQPCT